MRVSTLGAIITLTLALGAPASAFAQEPGGEAAAPPTPPAPPPAAPPPAAPPPAAPPPAAPPPAAPPPAAPPPAASDSAPAAKPTSLLSRFAGSYIDWGHVANAELLGLGGSYISPDAFSYVMSWNIAPSFYVYRSDRHDVRVRANLGVSVELTNSNTTTTRNEAEIADLPLRISDTIALASWGGANAAPPGPAAAFNPSLEGGREYGTWLVTEGGVVFPTSKEGSAYRVLATTLGVGVRQRIKLLGSAAPGLQNVTLYLGEGWRHDFNRTVVPTSSGASTPRQTLTGDPLSSDVTSKWLLTTDRLATSFSMILPIYGPLELSGGFAYQLDFKPPPPTSGCIQTLTGCAGSTPSANAATQFSYTRFDLALAYRFLPELVVDVGYDTFTSTLNQAGTGANPLFHVGDTVFYADVAFLPEQLFQRIARSAPAPAPVASR